MQVSMERRQNRHINLAVRHDLPAMQDGGKGCSAYVETGERDMKIQPGSAALSN